MLEHLGLGITLNMEDNFTPKAKGAMKTMTQFESQVDNMSKRVEKSMYNLQNIMLAGFSLNTVGGSIQKTGATILKVFKGIGNEIASVGAEYQTQQAQLLTAFKGNAEEAKQAFAWIRSEAGKTPYDVSGLTTAFQRLKTSGIDIRNSFKTANGDVKKLSDAIGDLATRNMTSSGGASGMAYALQEAWANQTRSIINRFNLAKADIADMMKYAGKDQQKFAEEFIKLADRLAPDAMKNMQGTWAQVMSNMQDTWNNFIYDLGQSGIFNEMLKTLDHVQKSMENIFGDTANLKAFSDILSSLWKPIDSIVKGLAKAIGYVVEFAKQHPKLTKFIATFVAISGAGMVLTGFVMKLTGSFLILGASLASTYLNFKLIKSLNMAGEFDFMWKSAGRAGRTLGILGLTIAGIALAMQSNFMGIRDKAETAFKHVRNAWQKSDYVVKNGVVSLQKMGEEYDNLTQKFVKLRMCGVILKNTFFGKTDEKGGILYTEDEITNLRKFGLLPMAQTFAILKGRAINFFNGLKDGIGSAFVIAKNFLDMVLTPIKEVLKVIGIKIDPIKKIQGKLGLNGDAGMDAGEAEKQSKLFQDVGKKAGILLGAILGFKIIKTISPILTSPFKLMSKAVGGAIKSVGKLKDSVKTGLGGIGGAIGSPFKAVGGFFSGNAKRAKGRFNDYLNEYQEQPKYHKRSDMDGYSKVKSMPNRFSKFVAPNTYGEVDANNMYTKDRSKLGQKLFGNTYYTKDASGQMQKVGKWGGRLNADRDDQQLIMSLQKQQASTGIRGTIKKPTLADFDGDKEAYRNTMKQFPRLDPYIGNASENLKGLSPTELDAQQSEVLKKDKTWKNRFKSRGLDGRKLTSEQKQSVGNETIEQLTKGNSAMAEIDKKRKLGSTQLFANNKQSKLSQALFGKKIYAQEQGEDGTLSKRVVARTGGIFRKSENDMVYNPERTMGERFKSFGSGVSSKIKAGASNLGGKFMNTGVGRALGSGASAVSSGAKFLFGGNAVDPVTGDTFKQKGLFGRSALGQYIDKQKERLSVGASDKPKKSFGQKLKGGFNFLFGKEKTDDETGLTTQKQGLFGRMFGKAKGFGKGVGKFGKGVGKIGGGILRGAGKLAGGVGKMAMGALPIAGMALSAGKMGFDMIKAKGGGDFKKGLGMLKEDIDKIDLSKIWDKFKDTAKSSFGTIGEIAKVAFEKLKEVLPTVLADAWEGIKGMAGIAWDWIKENGVGMIGNLVSWIISDGLPMLFDALIGIGKWIMTDLFPFLWDVLKEVVPKIAKGILDFLVEGLKTLGDFLGDIVVKGLTAVLRLLLPKPLENPVLEALGLPTHHGGLYMSPNEHMALIRKDETVLPPNISKGFDDILKNSNPKNPPVPRGVGSNTSSQPIDNSVTIEKVEIVVKADKLSRAEARQQAKMILEEIKSMNKESMIRSYK